MIRTLSSYFAKKGLYEAAQRQTPQTDPPRRFRVSSRAHQPRAWQWTSFGVRDALPLALALTAGVIGLILLMVTLRERPPVPAFVAPGQVAEAGGLFFALEEAEWVDDMEGGHAQGGHSEGVPPEGERRLHAEVSIRNPGDQARDLGLDDIRLISAKGTSRPPISSTFETESIGPRQSLYGDLYFDVAEKESSLYLVWTRGYQEVHIPVAGSPAGHGDSHEAGVKRGQ